MAVQQWELQDDRTAPSLKLELVPAPPRGGRVIPALLFVALIVGGIGYPVIKAATADVPAIPHEVPRALPVSQLASIDPISEMPRDKWPTSSAPAGGILFVRCTNLWVAQPDGSHARKLLSFSGISSPAFSPDAKTIAFIGPTEEGQGLYMVAADGSGLVEVGTLVAQGSPVLARITNLTWSESGNELAFALVDPAFSPWAGGSTIWTWAPSTGWFDRIASGWPSPAFVDGHLAYSSRVSTPNGPRVSFRSLDTRAGYLARGLSSRALDDLTFGVSPTTFSDSRATRHGAVVLRRDEHDDLVLVTKDSAWVRNVHATYSAPSPYSFFALGHVSVAQDSSRAVVDLRDPHGDRALGLLDLRSGDWTVLEYAWSGVATPAPTSSGPLGAQRAERFAGDVFSSWQRDGSFTAAALLIGDRDRDRFPMRRGSFAVGAATRTTGGWNVPVTTYGRGEDRRYSYRTATMFFGTTTDDRVHAKLRSIEPTHPLETIEDAKAFIATVTRDIGFAWPSYLPPGTELNQRWPVDAYSYDDSSTASVHLTLPEAPNGYAGSLNISYGDVEFMLGCGDGGSMDPDAVELAGRPGLFDQLGDGGSNSRQVLWPATLEQQHSATYSVSGELRRAELMRIAASMASQT
ncbi:MAG: hypothetical protein QOG04_370 [Actinomycetota bacterium]|nr:hypothetical protein [Actinomycetota bacterium]